MLVHLAAAAVLAANPVTPPPDLPELPEEPVVTELGNVTVAWTAGDYPQILVGWQEPASMRNRVAIVTADGSPYADVATLAPTDPNRVTLYPGHIDAPGTYRVAVHEIDADGDPVGEPALSPVFDNDRVPAPRIDAVEPRPDGTVRLRWTPRPPGPDTTPGDPLDLPVDDPIRVVPIASNDRPQTHDELSEPVRGTSFVIPAERRAPVVVGVKAVNEWGEAGAVVEVRGTRVTASVPARVAAGARLQITGLVHESMRACDLAFCWPIEHPEQSRAVELQARTGAAAGWQVVATAHTGKDGTYRFGLVSPGTRQYRVVAPPVSWSENRRARTFAASAPVTTTSVPVAPGNAAGGGDGDDGGTGAGGGLPITGAPAGATAGTGVLLVVLGALLCAVGRRRPRSAA